MKVVLFGMKHCGKSTLGRELARRWDCPFFDTDLLIEKRYSEETGKTASVRQIMLDFGAEEAWLRTLRTGSPAFLEGPDHQQEFLSLYRRRASVYHRHADLVLDVRGLDRVQGQNDSLGGIVECRANGVPPGLGEPVFDKLDADLAKAMLSIGAVKGIEFGAGFRSAAMKGSEHNDWMASDGFRSNNAGRSSGRVVLGAGNYLSAGHQTHFFHRRAPKNGEYRRRRNGNPHGGPTRSLYLSAGRARGGGYDGPGAGGSLQATERHVSLKRPAA